MASFKYQLFRLAFALIPGGGTRSRIIQKEIIFSPIGKNILWQPRKLPADPKRIRLHNNIQIASGVTFINHDIIGHMLNNLETNSKKINQTRGCIEILDNVAIGSNTIILPNIQIGPNVIIGAGSIVTKDIPEGVVVAGNPARVIGTFDDYVAKRKQSTEDKLNVVTDDDLWIDFYQQRQVGETVIAD